MPHVFVKDVRTKFDLSRADYSEKSSDVVQRAGINVHWMDNNSGCKGVCQRVSYEEIPPTLITNSAATANVLIWPCLSISPSARRVPAGKLNCSAPKGSHGPSYFERSPQDLKPFQPECRSNQLQRCSSEEISNAYDNSIAYTDHVLGQLINQLKNSDQYATALLYLSDHG